MLWRGLGDDASQATVSIPKLIEADAEVLRARYLAWVYELGERRIHGRRLVDHLEARPGFSFWWMTLLAEKCNFSKSPQITDAIRLMAFENWLAGREIRKIVLVSAERPLAECIRLWCLGSCVVFEWQRSPDAPAALSWTRQLHQYLPYPLQALIWLIRHLLQSWPLRGVGLSQWRESKGQVTFFSYLFNLIPDAVKAGRFESRYWAHLPDELERVGCKTNWLHLHVKDALLPDETAAAGAIRQFNEMGRGVQTHATLGTFLNARVIFGTLLDAGRLAWKGRRLRRALSVPQAKGPTFDFWPLFEEDWRRSTSGLTAMSNALYLNLFESALKMLPTQRLGVYLQENQGWEFALIHAWKSAGHGRLIGSPHATVRYWDLRYFFDPRSYVGGHALPMPDLVALNGTAELDAYRNGGYPVDAMIEVEALRYLHLAKARTEPDFLSPSASRFLRILVLGDYLLSNTRKQIHLLEKALPHLPEGTIIIVKPHPACPLQPADFPGVGMEMAASPMWELLSGCDVAYTSNATSAAADVYCAGLPVVSMLDSDALNQSPLRGREGVFFVSTPEDLADALLSAAAPRSDVNGQEFFTLDSKLPRWRKLLLEVTE